MIRVTVNSVYQTRALLFLGAILMVWFALVWLVLSQCIIYEGGEIYSFFWFIGYIILSFSTANAFIICVAYLLVKTPPPLPELHKTPENKFIAIICPVKNEEDGLYERLKFSLANNIALHIDFWLLSDSDKCHEKREKEVVSRLRENFCLNNIYYRRRNENTDFKPGNIAEWLFRQGGERYDYFFTLDADSIVMPGTVEKLLRKAEHPANKRIWLYQCKTGIIHDFTYFAHIQKISLEIHERLVFPTIYAICGQWISYGHSNLINTKGFILANPPTAELSHDVWDAAALDEAGHCAVMAVDCVVYEEAPANYLVAHKRDKRWAQGSLSALKIIVNNKVSIIGRFNVFIGGLQFINNLIFFPWLILQFCNMVFWDFSAIQFPLNYSMGKWAMNGTLLFATIFAVLTFELAPFLVARNLQEIRSFAWCALYSHLTMMNNLVNGFLNVLSVCFFPKNLWTPMEKNPYANSQIYNLLKKTIPTSIISSALLVMAWQSGHIYWIMFTSLLLLGGILSPIISWLGGTVRYVDQRKIDFPQVIIKKDLENREDFILVESRS